MYIPWKNICKVIVQVIGLSFILLFSFLLIYLLVVWSLVAINIISLEFTLLNMWGVVLGVTEALFIFPFFFITSFLTLSAILLFFRYVFWNARKNPSFSKTKKKILITTSLVLLVGWLLGVYASVHYEFEKLDREAYERESIPIIYFSEGVTR